MSSLNRPRASIRSRANSRDSLSLTLSSASLFPVDAATRAGRPLGMEISANSKICRDAIQQLADVAKGSWADDHLRRFNVWVANSSALAIGRAYHFSMDWRLRENPHLASFFVRQLQLLTRYTNLLKKIAADENNVITLELTLPPSAYDETGLPGSSASLSSSSSSSSSKSVSASGPTLRSLSYKLDEVSRTQYFVEEILDQIIRLTVFIRKAGWQDRYAKAALYEDIQGGVNLTSDYRKEAILIVKYHFPKASDILQERLSESLSIRQRQLAYFRAQKHDRLSLTAALDATEESMPAANPNQDNDSQITKVGEVPRLTKAAAEVQTKSQIGAKQYDLMSASAIQPGLTRSIVSAPSSVRSSKPTSESKLWYPSLSFSQTSITSKEFECPICFLILPIEKTETEKWHQHVLHDAQPFICVFDDCHSSSILYRTMSKWIEHLMERHSRKWHCTVISHPEITFYNEKEYETHMETEHVSLIDETDLSILAEKSSFVAHWTESLPECPLCKYTPEDIEGRSHTLQYHIVDHLEHLAIQVILQLYDANQDSRESEIGFESVAVDRNDAGTQGSREANEAMFPWSLWTLDDSTLSVNDDDSHPTDQVEVLELPNDFNCDSISNHPTVCRNKAYPDQLHDKILKELIADKDGCLGLVNSAKYQRCLEYLFGANPQGGFEDARRMRRGRVQNPLNWFLDHNLYKAWMNGGETPFLTISGAPGTGKTMLATFITDKLRQVVDQAQRGTFAYYFCCARDGKLNSARDVVRGLLWHILTQQPQLFTVEDFAFYTQYGLLNVDFDKLWAIFLKLLAEETIGDVYILIDGLDECDPFSQAQLRRSLSDLFGSRVHKPVRLRIILTSRLPVDVEIVFRGTNLVLEMSLPLAESLNDIRRFIKVGIDVLYQQNGWGTDQAWLIKDELNARAKGNFLWAALALAELSKTGPLSTLSMIEDTLQAMPPGLDELYEWLLFNINEDENPVTKLTLRILCAAHRPLILPELGMALAISQARGVQSELPTRHIIESFENSYKLCRPMLQHDPEKNTVRFCHLTARDYLKRADFDITNRNTKPHIDKNLVHHTLFEICCALLSAKELDQFAVQMCSKIEGQKQWWKGLDPVPPLLSYAAENWHLHAQAVDDAYAVEKLTVRQLLQLRSNRPRLFYSLMRLTAATGRSLLLSCILSIPNVSVDAVGFGGLTALFGAAGVGHEAAVNLLLEKGANPDSKDNNGQTPLWWAAMNGHEAVVKLLLEKGADLESKDNDGETPLWGAAANGHEAVAKLLLEKGADPDSKDNNGQTPLWWAAANGYEAVVKLLLEKGANSSQI